MEQEADKDARLNELNQIAEFVIQRIQDKLRGLEFHNPNKKTEVDMNNPQSQTPISAGSGPKNFKEQVDILIK